MVTRTPNTMSHSNAPSKSQLLLDATENALRAGGREMHFTQIAELVYPQLGLANEPPARLNGVLHDDSSGRFRRTGRGLWSLARWAVQRE
ncbi:MAG: hypothetical protein JWM41_2430 [Gemmatimonadetes bacterium]|jgi:hypothetical protein|nr:hypothetical protein [Gemmatimonadota bacterium]